MADEIMPQAGNSSTPSSMPQAGNHPATPLAGDKPPADETISLEEARKLRSEAKNLRERLKAAEAAEAELKKLKDADLSEVERLKKELTEKDQAATQSALRARAMQVRVKAIELGLIPDAAERMLDVAKLDDSNDAITAALGDALKTYPWLRNSQPGVTTPAGAPGKSTTTLTREQIEKMTPAEINARWTEVQQVMKQG